MIVDGIECNPVKLSFRDTTFGGTERITPFIEWDYSCKNKNVCVYTDRCLEEKLQAKINIAWIIEPPSINPDTYKYLINNPGKFDYIVSHNKAFLELPNFNNVRDRLKFYMFGGCWVPADLSKVYPKSKMLSICASWKKFAPGHALRHEVISKLKDRMEVMGNGFRKIDAKVEAHADYKYSIVIENEKSDWWITEKLFDCLACGSVPIYWGCPDVGRFLNTDGMIIFNTISDLEYILNHVISDFDYNNRITAIQDNFIRTNLYRYPERSLLEALRGII